MYPKVSCRVGGAADGLLDGNARCDILGIPAGNRAIASLQSRYDLLSTGPYSEPESPPLAPTI
jgi:hypothetical protein